LNAFNIITVACTVNLLEISKNLNSKRYSSETGRNRATKITQKMQHARSYRTRFSPLLKLVPLLYEEFPEFCIESIIAPKPMRVEQRKLSPTMQHARSYQTRFTSTLRLVLLIYEEFPKFFTAVVIAPKPMQIEQRKLSGKYSMP
jgi:hypothetical protein